jgi:hypothetical protein
MTLCPQQEPSIFLILLTLEELAKHARKADAEDAEVYEEIARQAIKQQTKVDVTSLCLSLLGGRAPDAISKAISKCLKEKVESRNGDNCSKPEKNAPDPENSPLHNLYPFMYQMGFQLPFAANFPQPQGYGYRNPRPRSYTPNYRPRGAACLFCDSTSHKYCDKMKAAKGK